MGIVMSVRHDTHDVQDAWCRLRQLQNSFNPNVWRVTGGVSNFKSFCCAQVLLQICNTPQYAL